MRALKAAVVGAGNMGRFHANNYTELPAVELAAVADTDGERARAVATGLRCRAYTDLGRMLSKERPDVVSVAVPTRDHRAVAVACLEAGANVLVEKPIASTLEDAEAIVRAAKQCGRVLAVGHIERFNPAVQRLKALVDEGRLGEISSIIARRVGVCPPRITDADVVVDLAVHDIDVIGHLLGGQPDVVEANGGKAIVENRTDYADIFLRYGRTSALVSVNWITPVKIRKLHVTGTKGYAELDYITQDLTLFESNYCKSVDDFGQFVITFSLPNKVEVGVAKEQPLRRELADLVAAVRDGRPPLVTTDQALDALRCALEVQRRIRR